MTEVDIRHGDCLEVLRDLPDNSVDSVVCDPPYGLSNTKPAQVADVLAAWVTGDTEAVPAKKGGFMGKDWDSFVPPPTVWAECLRALKPGGHMVVFAGARTQDLMGLSIRLAGFEIRDTLGWIYGSGFPKSMDVSKAIDKAAGAEREVVGSAVYGDGHIQRSSESIGYQGCDPEADKRDITAPATTEAQRWDGWGTALKPAIEPIILARKPLVGTVAQNVLEHGVGGLNIDASRVESTDSQLAEKYASVQNAPPRRNNVFGEDSRARAGAAPHSGGRFPANVLLDEHAAQEMDRQSGVLKTGSHMTHHVYQESDNASMSGKNYKRSPRYDQPANEGGASRFFPVFKYQAKAPKKERPVITREDGTKVQHPTVKPLALMEWLVTLVTPEGGTVLDPFAGTGTTLQAARDKGFRAIGVEQDPDYIRLINARLETAAEDGALF